MIYHHNNDNHNQQTSHKLMGFVVVGVQPPPFCPQDPHVEATPTKAVQLQLDEQEEKRDNTSKKLYGTQDNITETTQKNNTVCGQSNNVTICNK